MAGSSLAPARAILLAAFPGVSVSQQAPKKLPRRFIRISRVGGKNTRELDAPLILVEAFASTTDGEPDAAQAEQDASAVDAAMRSASSSPTPWADRWVSMWEGGNIVDFPDPDEPHHSRWQLTGTLYLLNN